VLWVLDTNVVLDLLLFDDAATRPLRYALELGRVCGVVTDATLAELRRVLEYPGFGLDPFCQAALFSRYLALSFRVPAMAAGVSLPRCSDPDDQPFLELAAASRAASLVSKDRAVLKLRRRCAPHFRIMTPAEAANWLGRATESENMAPSGPVARSAR
jgi:putative PIN family toxin of toxin-antitoxin system